MQANQITQTVEAALKHYQQALLRDPNDMNAQIHCANLCAELKRYEEAAGYFRRIVRALKSNLPARDALCFVLQEMGNAAHSNGQFMQAETCFEEALSYQPGNAIFWYNIGNAQRESGKLAAALNSFKQSIRFNPNDADAHNNLGNIQRELGQLDLAISSYARALALNPNLYHALAHLVHQKQHVCAWDDLHHSIQQLRDWVMTKPNAQISPFALLSMHGTTAAEQKQCASNWASNLYRQRIQQQIKFSDLTLKTGQKKLTIGFLSADFRLHPLAFLITELIEQIDSAQFTTIAYADGVDDQSPERKRLQKAFDVFHDIRHLSDSEAAKKIHQDGVAILVDLTGFTKNSRTGIVAFKPAPISVNWLGFPGTMGEISNVTVSGISEKSGTTPLFDYLLADKVIAPNSDDFSERLLYLPCYQPNNSQRPVAGITQKIDHKLPENSFVFCCFNQSFKITQEVFGVWMHILQQVPNSVLWLLDCNQWATANLRKEAAKAGVDADRLIFAPRVSIAEHLSRHAHADLFLDTSPYNAHTTASDALFMGLPLLTCAGETFASRVASSLLQQMDLTDLSTKNWSEYASKAAALANDTAAIQQLKMRLTMQIEKSPLFQPALFAQNLQNQCLQIWQDYVNTSA